VLLQELERFNKLIERLHTSLFDLKRALLGEIGMGTELEDLGNSLFNGFLPGMWSSLAP
jgi:dynein heavy chain